MKINLFILAISFVFLSCKDSDTKGKEEKSKQTETKKISKTKKQKGYLGEFIKVDDAAILKGKDFIYGVVLDSMGMELANQTEAYKSDEYDMIPVVVSGEIIPNEAEEGWEEFIKVEKIIRISEPNKEESIEIKKSVN